MTEGENIGHLWPRFPHTPLLRNPLVELKLNVFEWQMWTKFEVLEEVSKGLINSVE
jgi:hypothetical protein